MTTFFQRRPFSAYLHRACACSSPFPITVGSGAAICSSFSNAFVRNSLQIIFPTSFPIKVSPKMNFDLMSVLLHWNQCVMIQEMKLKIVLANIHLCRRGICPRWINWELPCCSPPHLCQRRMLRQWSYLASEKALTNRSASTCHPTPPCRILVYC